MIISKIFITILLVLSIPASAQVKLNFPTLFSNTFSKYTDKSKLGKYKAQKIKGKISGMGVFLFNNGNIYYGDFFEKAFHGKGTLISKDSISYCPSASIYVGKFKNGLKNGIGRCYTSDGELLYEGRFKDDRPLESYPNNAFNTEILPYFTEFTTEAFTFLGEFVGDTPSGTGIFVFTDGDVYLTELVNGNPNGIGVLIQTDDNWMSEKIEDGHSTPISSSSHYELLKQRANENLNSVLSESLGYFSQALQIGSQLTSQSQFNSTECSIQLPEGQFDGINDTYIDNDDRINRSQVSEKYSISEQQSYNRDKSTYHKYDGLLSKYFDGNGTASASEIKNWQNKMRKLREKWEKKGRDFPHFPNEDR